MPFRQSGNTLYVTNHHCAVRKVVSLAMLCRLFVATCPTRRIGPSVALSNCLLGGEIKRGAGEISLGWGTCKLHSRPYHQPHFQQQNRSALSVRSRAARGTSLSAMRIARTETFKITTQAQNESIISCIPALPSLDVLEAAATVGAATAAGPPAIERGL